MPADEDETSEEEDSCRSLVKFFFPDMVVVCVCVDANASCVS